MTIVFDTPEGIAFYMLATRKGALSLENKGIKNPGGNVYELCKRTYNLTGTRVEVLDQMKALVEAAIAARSAT